MRRKSSNSVKVFYPKYNRETLLKVLKDRVSILRFKIPLKAIVLFGSYAKNNYTAFSDIDLLIIYRGKRESKYYKIIKETLGIKGLEIHMYSDEEYKLNKTIVNKMIKDGVVIYRK